MKTQIIAVSILAGLVFSARATIITHDPYSMAQNAVHEVINIVKYAGTQIKTTETALNTLRTYEQQVVQLARLGNPAALRALPGVSTVAELYGTGQQLMYNYQSWQQYLNPQRYQGDMNYILSSYRQPNWQVYSASQAEQRAAAAYKGIDTDLQALPADNFREMHLWSGR